jgi:hypothetical protein
MGSVVVQKTLKNKVPGPAIQKNSDRNTYRAGEGIKTKAGKCVRDPPKHQLDQEIWEFRKILGHGKVFSSRDGGCLLLLSVFAGRLLVKKTTK